MSRISASVLAEELGICKATVYRWVPRGLPCFKTPGGQYRFDLDEAVAWLRGYEEPDTEDPASPEYDEDEDPDAEEVDLPADAWDLAVDDDADEDLDDEDADEGDDEPACRGFSEDEDDDVVIE